MSGVEQISCDLQTSFTPSEIQINNGPNIIQKSYDLIMEKQKQLKDCEEGNPVKEAMFHTDFEKRNELEGQLKALKKINNLYETYQETKFDSLTNKQLRKLFNNVLLEIKSNQPIDDDAENIASVIKNKIESHDSLNTIYKNDYIEKDGKRYLQIAGHILDIPFNTEHSTNLVNAIKLTSRIIKKLEAYPDNQIILIRDNLPNTYIGPNHKNLGADSSNHYWDLYLEKPFRNDILCTNEEFKDIFLSQSTYTDMGTFRDFLNNVR